MRKIVSTLLIIVGMSIIAYPKASELYGNYQQQKLIDSWQASLSIVDQGDMDETDEEMDFLAFDYFQEEELLEKERKKQDEVKDKFLSAKEKKEQEKRAREEYIKNNLDGVIKIDKIDLYQPILRGATKYNMSITVASMEHSGKIGDIGNYAIAGHRSRAYGRNFNRLDEVVEGDIIELLDGENTYQYEVFEKLYVYPEETWVLKSDNMEKEVTLITCHPMNNPTHRLIIKAKIIE